MDNQIFREKNIDRVNSPEDLQDYVRVTTPAVWLLIVAIIVLLAGACIWGTFGLVKRTLHLTAFVDQNVAYLYVPEEELSSLQVGNSVTVNEETCTISAISDSAMPIRYYMEQFFEDGYNWENLVDDPSEKVVRVSANTDLQDGMYAASIIVEEVHPISFLLN